MRGYVSSSNQNEDSPLIGRQGALCGNVCYAVGEYYATEHAVVVTNDNKYITRFLYYLLVSMNLNQYKTAGAQPGLSVAKLEKIMVPIPPLAEQTRIVAILDRFDALCNHPQRPCQGAKRQHTPQEQENQQQLRVYQLLGGRKQ